VLMPKIKKWQKTLIIQLKKLVEQPR
jgi:hypothetical protein